LYIGTIISRMGFKKTPWFDVNLGNR
jgi:hypothetical protein